MKALEKLIAEYEKQIEIYLDENMFCPDRKKQYEKCCTISQCCKLLGMTENQDNRIIYRVQTKIKNKKYN